MIREGAFQIDVVVSAALVRVVGEFSEQRSEQRVVLWRISQTAAAGERVSYAWQLETDRRLIED